MTTPEASSHEALLKNAAIFLRVACHYAPDQHVNDQNLATGEHLKVQGLRTTMMKLAQEIEACLSSARSASAGISAPRELVERVVVLLKTYAEHGMDALYPSGERTPNAILADEVAAAFNGLLAVSEKAGSLAPSATATRVQPAGCGWSEKADQCLYMECSARSPCPASPSTTTRKA